MSIKYTQTMNETPVFASIYLTLLYRITGHTKYLISPNIIHRCGHVSNANIPFFPFAPHHNTLHPNHTRVTIYTTTALSPLSLSLSAVQIFDNGFPFWLHSDILKWFITANVMPYFWPPSPPCISKIINYLWKRWMRFPSVGCFIPGGILL